MSEKAHVFISYAREDRERIAILARCLEAEGWKVWWDSADIRAGQRFSAVIDEALDAAACIVVAWSHHSKSSRWVLAEAHAADEENKLVPIFLDAVRPPVFFRGMHAEDLSCWQGDRTDHAYGRLLSALERFVPRTDTAKPDEAHLAHAEQPRSRGRANAVLSSELRELLERIADPSVSPSERLGIGDRLAELGDPRQGVGLDDQGLPDIDWVEIPAGVFTYSEDREKRELPNFFMARYPITNAQYKAFIDAGGYHDKRWWKGLALRIERPKTPMWTAPNRPRETVSWYEAMAYCRWLSNRLGLEVRLPNEYEWEKAARGGVGRAYPWGATYRPGCANIDEINSHVGSTYLGQTTAVGLYPHGASPYGVEDLAGNVWEWCLNEYEDPDRADPGGEAARVLRGGSWYYYPGNARASNRNWYHPVIRDFNLGFRVVCSSPNVR